MKKKSTFIALMLSVSAVFISCSKKSDNNNSTPAPVASFTYSPGAVYGEYNFTSTSTNATTYSWSFGEYGTTHNNTSTSQNPTHIFYNGYNGSSFGGYGNDGASNATGKSTVTLTVTGAGGSNTTTQSIPINNGAYLNYTGFSGVGVSGYWGNPISVSASSSIVNGSGSGNQFTIAFISAITVGTFDLSNTNMELYLNLGGVNYQANQSLTCSSASVTITSISSSEITGTFTCTLVENGSCPASSTVVITDGKFGANF